MALGAAVLAHDPAGKALRNPEQSAQGLNSPAAPLRAQKFPSASSLSMALSSSASASNRLTPSVHMLQLLEALGLSGFHATVELLPAVVRGSRNLKGPADLSDGSDRG
jgi:hypothetical protein